ncbi:hypothetical protein MTO96_033675 [Rhipicephalus appendiculatus]
MASHKQHKDRDVKAVLWSEVAVAVLPNVDHKVAVDMVQKRWKSLRDKFRRLINNVLQARKSGAGRDDVDSVDTSWPYFELLMFLKDTMVSRPTSGNFEMPASQAYQLSQPAEVSQQHSSDDEMVLLEISSFDANLDTVPDICEVTQTETVPQAESVDAMSTLVTLSTPVTPSPPSSISLLSATPTARPANAISAFVSQEPTKNGSKRKRKSDEADDALATNMAELTKTLKDCPVEDQYYHWAMGLTKFLKKVPQERQLDLEIDLLQLIKSYTE